MNLFKNENNEDFELDIEIEKMKRQCLKDFNCQVELFKLLERKNLKKLIERIPKKSYSSYVSLDNSKPTMFERENAFLRNLDNYILFIKDNFDVELYNLIDIVDATIYYSSDDILYCLDERKLHNDKKYFISYFNMFYYPMFDNLHYYSKRKYKNYYVKEFYKEISNYDIENKNNINKIIKLLKRFFNNKYENIHYLFMKHNDMNELDQSFEIEKMFENYYSQNLLLPFTLSKDDNYIMVDSKSKLLFNILTNVDSLNNEDNVLVEFGISNVCFNLKVKDYLFRKKELLKLYSKLKNIKTKDKRYNEEISFINPTLKFSFWGDDDLGLDIKFYCNGGLDSYTLYLDLEDIINLYEILEKQLF